MAPETFIPRLGEAAGHPVGPWLKRQPVEFQRDLLALATLETFEAGEAVWRTGESLECLLGVIDGCVALSRSASHETDALIGFCWAGDWAGEMEFVSGVPSFTSVEARTHARLALVDYQKLTLLLDEKPKWWNCVAALEADHARYARDTVADLRIHDPTARCVSVILRMIAGALHADTPAAPNILVPMSQVELAALANLHRNSVGTILRKLVAEGLLINHYRAIEVTDPAGLQRRARTLLPVPER